MIIARFKRLELYMYNLMVFIYVSVGLGLLSLVVFAIRERLQGEGVNEDYRLLCRKVWDVLTLLPDSWQFGGHQYYVQRSALSIELAVVEVIAREPVTVTQRFSLYVTYYQFRLGGLESVAQLLMADELVGAGCLKSYRPELDSGRLLDELGHSDGCSGTGMEELTLLHTQLVVSQWSRG